MNILGNLPGHSSSEQPLFPPLLREVWFLAKQHYTRERFPLGGLPGPRLQARPQVHGDEARQDLLTHVLALQLWSWKMLSLRQHTSRLGSNGRRQSSAASSHVLAQPQLPYPQNG